MKENIQYITKGFLGLQVIDIVQLWRYKTCNDRWARANFDL